MGSLQNRLLRGSEGLSATKHFEKTAKNTESAHEFLGVLGKT